MANSNLQEALLRAATGRNPSVSDAAIAGQTVQQLLGQGNGSYGYDSYLGDLESQYQQMEAAIEAQRAAQLSRIQAQYDAAVEKLERQRPAIEQNYEDTAKQAYTQNMLAKRDLPQQLAAQGLTGGLSESSQLALEADLNAYINLARGMIEKKYSVDGNDRHLKILNASHINEDEYFSSIVHDDIDSIIRDIKEAHSGDKDSAPADDWVDELKRDIDYAASVQGTPQKRQAILYCRRLGIDYKKLTDVEFEVLIRVLKKSKLLHNPGGGQKRGKKRK